MSMKPMAKSAFHASEADAICAAIERLFCVAVMKAVTPVARLHAMPKRNRLCRASLFTTHAIFRAFDTDVGAGRR